MRRLMLLAFLGGLLPLATLHAQTREFVLKPAESYIFSPDVIGRFDQLAVDEAGKRLFLAALDHGSVQVIDLATRQATTGVSGLSDPAGVLWMPDLQRLAVTARKSGTLHFYDKDLKPLGTLSDLPDADNLRYDPAAKRLYVAYASALLIVDAQSMTKTGEVPLEGHPEGMVWEQHGPRLFVNVPKARHVAVIDRRTHQVSATWPLEDAELNFPMALDEPRQRLFIGCRKPRVMLVLDTDSGRTVSKHECCGDADALWVDTRFNRVYLSGGGGCVNSFELAGGTYTLLETLSTGYQARTSLFVPSLNRLFVAIPYRLRIQKASLRAFEPQP